MAQATKLLYITLNGVQLRIEPGATLKPGGFKREPMVGVHSFDFTKEPIPSEVKFTLIHVAGESIENIAHVEDGELVCQADTGATWVITGAFCGGEQELSNGKVSFVFYGRPAEEDAP